MRLPPAARPLRCFPRRQPTLAARCPLPAVGRAGTTNAPGSLCGRSRATWPTSPRARSGSAARASSQPRPGLVCPRHLAPPAPAARTARAPPDRRAWRAETTLHGPVACLLCGRSRLVWPRTRAACRRRRRPSPCAAAAAWQRRGRAVGTPGPTDAQLDVVRRRRRGSLPLKGGPTPLRLAGRSRRGQGARRRGRPRNASKQRHHGGVACGHCWALLGPVGLLGVVCPHLRRARRGPPLPTEPVHPHTHTPRGLGVD